ncbi:MAG: sulfotransferase [Gammaproteobacteria bacterium]|nr:sulfotransferase [Gammaproteobacteria bacterium]
MSPRLELGSLLTAAVKTAKVDDFGSDDFHEPLQQLLGSLDEGGKLHPFGQFYVKQMLLGLLVNRLKLVELWKSRPQLISENITAPLIILGLPRTGTSFLFELLAQDPAHRYLTNWEATVAQVPQQGRYSWNSDPRRKVGRRLMRFQNYLAPGMGEIHSFHLDGPEECTPLLMQGFNTLAIASMLNVPGYSQWLNDAPHKETYYHFKKVLQTLQWKYPGERWLLKSPSHIEAVDSLLEVFPDARLIQTHRDPVKAVTSFASLCAAFRGICCPNIDMDELGEQVLNRLSHDFSAYLRVRKTCAQERFYDLMYSDLVADPEASIDDIYQYFGMALTAPARQQMLAYLGKEREGGGHSYSPEDFGLNAEQIRDRFQDYIEAFEIPVDE